MNWSDNGGRIDNEGAVMVNESLRFRSMLSWTRVSSGSLAVRLKTQGYMFDMTGPAGFGMHDDLLYNCAFLNSSIGKLIAQFLSASLDFQPGQVASYPVIISQDKKPRINDAVVSCEGLSKLDWDSFETSWDFKRHPLL